MDSESNESKRRSYIIIFVMVAVLVILLYLIYSSAEQEKNSWNENVTTQATTEMVQHCIVDGCPNEMAEDSIYCEEHKKQNELEKSQTTEAIQSSFPDNLNGGKKIESTYRHSSSSNKTTEKSTTEFDPEDHDIEGYYEDNKGDYENYEDAYHGFEDDEDSWEDY